MFVAGLFSTLATRFYLIQKNKQLSHLEQKLLAGTGEVNIDNKLLVETSEVEGTDSLGAAKLAAAYRYWT
jgi:hypothetical protein